MRERNGLHASTAHNDFRHEMLDMKIELSSITSLGTTITVKFFSLKEANSYFYDVNRRIWSSLDSINYDRNVSEGDLSWIPDDINADEADEIADDIVCSEDTDEDSFYETSSTTNSTDDPKDRIKCATRRRNHWTKDQLRPAEVCEIMKKKAYKEIRDSKRAFEDDPSAAPFTTRKDDSEKDTRGPIQKKFDAFFKAHVHAIPETTFSTKSMKNCETVSSCEVATLKSRSTRHVRMRTNVRPNTSKGIIYKKPLKTSKPSLVPGKYDYKKYAPIIFEHGYGFGLLYRHI